MTTSRKALAAELFASLWFYFASIHAAGAAVVTTVADSGAGSLRQALLNAVSGEMISFDPALSSQTLFLTNGQLSVTKNLTMDGSNLPLGINLDGRNASRVINVSPNVVATLKSINISRGNAAAGGGGIFADQGATLNLICCTVSGSSAGTSGGGGINVGLSGKLILDACTIFGNRVVSGLGGGIFLQGGSTLVATNSTIAGNSSSSMAGGIYSQSGTISLVHSTISGNSAASSGGGIYLNASFVTLTLTNTIVAGNSAPAASNIFGSFNGENNFTSGDPLLAPLGFHGGMTPTMPPLPGSPALDAGIGIGVEQDQRGFVRSAGTGPDIGAVEGVALVLTDVRFDEMGQLRFRFSGSAGENFRVMASTNLLSPASHWLDLGLATESPPDSGEFRFADPDTAVHPQRFYRVMDE